MPKGLLGKKIGMSRYFTEAGDAVAVTFIEVGPCTALQVKASEKDGYSAVQLGFGKRPKKAINKPEAGHFKKASVEPVRFIKEIAIDNGEEIKLSQQFFVDIFKQGDFVDISGLSIGKGFQGGMKRWNWKGGKASHGSMTHRRPGSIGASAYPSRVVKGHHMPGHMGNDWVTVQNLEIVEIDKDKNLLIVKGAVPGPKTNYLIVRKAIKGKKRSAEEPKEKAEEKPKEKAEKKPKEKPKKAAKKK